MRRPPGVRPDGGIAAVREHVVDVRLGKWAQHKALGTALAVLDLTRQSYQAGQASLLQLLESQRQYQQARLGHARAQGQRYADTAQWFIAMGGAPTP